MYSYVIYFKYLLIGYIYIIYTLSGVNYGIYNVSTHFLYVTKCVVEIVVVLKLKTTEKIINCPKKKTLIKRWMIDYVNRCDAQRL